MKFSEMPYVRPDLEQVREEGTAYVQALINAADFAQADAAFHQYSDMGDRVSTAVTLVSIRHSINTEDAFYAKEQEVLDEMMPLLQQLDAEFNKALYNSKFRPQFTENTVNCCSPTWVSSCGPLTKSSFPTCRRRTSWSPPITSSSPPPRSPLRGRC